MIPAADPEAASEEEASSSSADAAAPSSPAGKAATSPNASSAAAKGTPTAKGASSPATKGGVENGDGFTNLNFALCSHARARNWWMAVRKRVRAHSSLLAQEGRSGLTQEGRRRAAKEGRSGRVCSDVLSSTQRVGRCRAGNVNFASFVLNASFLTHS